MLSSNLVCFFFLLELSSATATYMLVSSSRGLASSRLEPLAVRQLSGALFFNF